MYPIEQGDILSIEGMKEFMLVVSKNFFNQSEQVIVCPFVERAADDPLHIEITAERLRRIVLCENVKLLDLRVRGFKQIGRVKYEDIINITDAIQSIFDY